MWPDTCRRYYLIPDVAPLPPNVRLKGDGYWKSARDVKQIAHPQLCTIVQLTFPDENPNCVDHSHAATPLAYEYPAVLAVFSTEPQVTDVSQVEPGSDEKPSTSNQELVGNPQVLYSSNKPPTVSPPLSPVGLYDPNSPFINPRPTIAMVPLQRKICVDTARVPVSLLAKAVDPENTNTAISGKIPIWCLIRGLPGYVSSRYLHHNKRHVTRRCDGISIFKT